MKYLKLFEDYSKDYSKEPESECKWCYKKFTPTKKSEYCCCDYCERKYNEYLANDGAEAPSDKYTR